MKNILERGSMGKAEKEKQNENGMCCKRELRALLTAEAALVLVVLMSVFITFIYLFQIIYVELELTMAATAAVEETADAGYLMKHIDEYLDAVTKGAGEEGTETEEMNQISGWEEIGLGRAEMLSLARELVYSVGSELWFREAVKSRLSDFDGVDSVIAGGYEGISFWGSDAYAEDEMTVVCMKYEIEFPVLQALLPRLSFQKNILMRSFSGEGSIEASRLEEEAEPETEEGYVFVTETGTVYHLSQSCTYICLSVEQSKYTELEKKRNRYGSKYYACESCAEGKGVQEKVWVTKSGTRYHYEEECSRLKRTVKKLPESEAWDYRPCSRCARSKEMSEE